MKGYLAILLIATLFLSGCVEQKATIITTTTIPAGGVTTPSGVESYTLTSPPLECDSYSRKSKSADYLIMVPKVMFTRTEASVSMSSFTKVNRIPTETCIKYSLVNEKTNKSIDLLEASTGAKGHATASFKVPALDEGIYSIIASVAGGDETFTGSVSVRDSPALIIETDKPIYKPSQKIQGRVLTLDNNLKPINTRAIVEISDAKGIKVFRENLSTNDFGVASFELPLASDLNFGTWKIQAESGSATTKTDVRVERYVLPKFNVGITLPKEWFLAAEEIKGTASAEYFFGKPVEGELKIEAFKYVGEWVKYTEFTKKLTDGSADFVLPAVEYVAGTPGAEGQGSLILNITVTDTGGHEEKTNKLLKITESSIVLKLIPESRVVKPTLPFQVLVVTETPDNEPAPKTVKVTATYKDESDKKISKETKKVYTVNGLYLVEFEPPEDVYAAEIHAEVARSLLFSLFEEKIESDLILQSMYSPSSSFIHLVQKSRGTPKVGDRIEFGVYSTHAGRVYYDVVADGRTVYSGTTKHQSGGLSFSVDVNPQMSPEAKVIAYMIQPDGEVSADTLPFDVRMEWPVELKSEFSKPEAEPGDTVEVTFDAKGESMIGVSIVDESVYALSEGRINLRQVFDELEKRFMEPQAEAHPVFNTIYDIGTTKPPLELIEDSGLQVLASAGVKFPDGKRGPGGGWRRRGWGGELMAFGALELAAPAAMRKDDMLDEERETAEPEGLAEVSRVRQFFPETWVWMPELMTDEDGKATLSLTVPDSITTWRLHSVSSSQLGLGLSETQLKVFQDFFVEPDLPYSVVRGEEFPVLVQVYNYLDTSQEVHLEIEDANWYTLLSDKKMAVEVAPNSVSSAGFTIKPTKLGTFTVDLTARTAERADAVKRELIVEAEGSPKDMVENGILKAGKSITLDTRLPRGIIPDSGRVYLSITPSIVGQTISGVDDLLHMPYGCGEQNMIMFAPDVEIMRYLEATKQLNPEIAAKADVFIKTGYQRELTYQHSDGAFSAFGENDKEGSLWLTTFVLGTFSGARDIHEVDENVLKSAADWIQKHQNEDGSWDHVGFLHHKEMAGSLSGKYSLTAYVVLALNDYGNAKNTVMEKAQRYLEDNLDDFKDDSYALAIGALALKKVGSDRAEDAIDSLIGIAKDDDNGIYWGDAPSVVEPRYDIAMEPRHIQPGKSVETTAYVALALIEAKNPVANNAVKWIVSQRNSQGGFSSTQDTVVAFKALIATAIGQGRDVDASISVIADGEEIGKFRVNPDNFDVLQIKEIPEDMAEIEISMDGKGEVNYQVVKKFNINLSRITIENDMELDVVYDTKDVSVNDIVKVNVKVKYTGKGDSTGMMIVDVSVPTGFAAVQDSLDSLVENYDEITKIEKAGRKIIIYVDDLPRGKELKFSIRVKARFPVKAIIQPSKAYAYYKPEITAESKGGNIVVS